MYSFCYASDFPSYIEVLYHPKTVLQMRMVERLQSLYWRQRTLTGCCTWNQTNNYCKITAAWIGPSTDDSCQCTLQTRLALKETDPEIWDAEDLHDFSESDSDAGFENQKDDLFLFASSQLHDITVTS